MESVEELKDLRYGNIRSLIGIVEGSEELAQFAARIISDLGKSVKQANPSEKQE